MKCANDDHWPKCRYCGAPSGDTEMVGVGFACAHCCVKETHLRDRNVESEWRELAMLAAVAEESNDSSLPNS